MSTQDYSIVLAGHGSRDRHPTPAHFVDQAPEALVFLQQSHMR